MSFIWNRLITLITLAGFALTIAAWFFLAPVQFGGPATYVIVDGNSMEPNLYRGDLVILHTAAAYSVGDVATYRHPDIGPIIHRIIQRDGERFVFQGDNNDFIDSYRPVQSELMGRFWLYLPKAGKLLERMRKPWFIALLTGVIGLAMVAPIPVNSAVRKRATRRQNGRAVKTGQPISVTTPRTNLLDLLLIFAALALAGGFLAFVAFHRPLTVQVSDPISYQHQGVFRYSAAAPPGIYDQDRVRTGEPIFRRLISQVEMLFDYTFSAQLPPQIQGTIQLDAVVRDNNGWQWTFQLQPPMAFDGQSATAAGTLDLNQVQAMLDSVKQQTGVPVQQFTLEVLPAVRVNGQLAGQILQESFAPSLLFSLNDLLMQLGEGSRSPGQLQPIQAGLIQRSREAPNTLSIFVLDLPISVARWVGLLVAGISGLATVLIGVRMLRQPSESDQIQSRYASLLVAVRHAGLDETTPVVQVAEMADLAKLAERSGQMILHEVQGATHRYVVHDGQVVYEYMVAPSQQAGGMENRPENEVRS